VDDWFNEDHLGRFVVQVIDHSISAISIANMWVEAPRSITLPPLLAVRVYGYATGVFSSRKIEATTYDSVALRFIATNSP
jgi:transposase